MQGIDLVNLQDPLLKPRSERALKLILHPEDVYPEGKDSFWWLWTAKEAIFKAHRELTNFKPTEIAVKIKTIEDQLVIEAEGLQGKIFTTPELIYSIVASDISNVCYQTCPINENDESAGIRQLLVKYCKDELQIATEVMTDGDNLPILNYKNTPVSLTHHAGIGGFCFPRIA